MAEQALVDPSASGSLEPALGLGGDGHLLHQGQQEEVHQVRGSFAPAVSEQLHQKPSANRFGCTRELPTQLAFETPKVRSTLEDDPGTGPRDGGDSLSTNGDSTSSGSATSSSGLLKTFGAVLSAGGGAGHRCQQSAATSTSTIDPPPGSARRGHGSVCPAGKVVMADAAGVGGGGCGGVCGCGAAVCVGAKDHAHNDGAARGPVQHRVLVARA
eukprot:g220.t1